MNPVLDEFLATQPHHLLKSRKKTLKFLRRAYSVCVVDFANKPRTDLTSESSQFSFHEGTPLPDLRQLTSWMLTNAPTNRHLARLVPALWKRHGREDLSVAGLLLANLKTEALGEDPWMAFIHLLQRSEPLMVVLEVAEELVRGGHSIPSDEWLLAGSAQSSQWHQYCVLFLSLRKGPLTCQSLVEQAPQGGEMFERIRSRLLASKH